MIAQGSSDGLKQLALCSPDDHYHVTMLTPLHVSLVLNPEFGTQLEDEVKAGPVWIIDTPSNRAAVEKHWADHVGESHLEGVTIFKALPLSSPEETLMAQLDMIDLHRATCRVICVRGAALSPRLEDALKEYGFVEFEPTQGGFKAIRTEA